MDGKHMLHLQLFASLDLLPLSCCCCYWQPIHHMAWTVAASTKCCMENLAYLTAVQDVELVQKKCEYYLHTFRSIMTLNILK